jgi:hypothetical protein
MMSKIIGTILGLTVPYTAAAESQVHGAFTWEIRWVNTAAVAGTTAVAELSVGIVKQTSALVGAYFCPSSGGVTANATNYFTLLVGARLAATPFTKRNLVTYAADTPTTDDIAQWDAGDVFTAYKTATPADLNLAAGEVLTVEVTKTGGSGLAFPAGAVVLLLKPRD